MQGVPSGMVENCRKETAPQELDLIQVRFLIETTLVISKPLEISAFFSETRRYKVSHLEGGAGGHNVGLPARRVPHHAGCDEDIIPT